MRLVLRLEALLLLVAGGGAAGGSPRLLVVTAGMDVLRSLGWEVRTLVVYGYTMAYQVVLTCWNDGLEESRGAPFAAAVVQALQPWR